ncbi:MAG TPA: ABC transporter permease, partial [Vicinamibacterales bacterium]|nr:ABC transporter permease [Vicinamibacterales bacterium]
VAVTAARVHTDLLQQDLRYVRRTLTRAPGFAITAVVLVALGIGATTAAFSVTDFVLIRPLPFPQPQRLVKLWESTPGYPTMELSPANYRDFKAAARSFESLGVYMSDAVTMTTEADPIRMLGARFSADLLPTLGVAPLMGRGFSDADDRPGAAGTIILSYALWQTQFGGDGGIVGRTIVLDDRPHTIIGVMPREFHFPASDVLFWRTNGFDERDYQDRGNNLAYAVGRLRTGVTIAQADAEMKVVAAQLRGQYPAENKDTGAVVLPLSEEVSDRSRLLLLALAGAAACLLLIACANLANLLLARALGRRRELAVRTAIGAGRERLVRQLMTESLLLAGVGGAVGIGLAVVSVPLLARLVPASLPIAAAPSVDLRVLAGAVALTFATGISFGLAPIVRVGRPDVDGLREGARSGSGGKERLRSALVVVEIMASVVLLVSAGLLIRALLTVQRIDPGFKSDGVLTLRASLPIPQYARVATREAFYSRVLDDVRAIPGVTGAGLISFLPMSSMRGGIFPLAVAGSDPSMANVRTANNVACLRYVTPGYFAALSIPITRGRDIADADDRDREAVAVVSESFVRRYFPDQDPIGRHFTLLGVDRVIVGVAGDVKFRGLERTSEPQVYYASKQMRDALMTYYSPRELAVKGSVAPATLAAAVRGVIRRVDPRVPVTALQTLDDLVGLETASRSVQVRVLGTFALAAFVLAAVGIHGLLSFTVSQRVQEIAVRIALGAPRREILLMVLRRGVRLAIAGVIPGIALAYAAGRSMEALLAGVKPADPATIAAAVTLAFVMTIVGSLAPAMRAIHVNPIDALKSE